MKDKFLSKLDERIIFFRNQKKMVSSGGARGKYEALIHELKDLFEWVDNGSN